MIYIKPKLIEADYFFIIKEGKVRKIIVDSVRIYAKSQSEYSIAYNSNNQWYNEEDKNFFLKEEEAQDLIDNGLQISLEAGDAIRYATASEIKRDSVVSTTSFFRKGIMYNQTTQTSSGAINLNCKCYPKEDKEGVVNEFLKNKL